MSKTNVPRILYHGTGLTNWPGIQENGLLAVGIAGIPGTAFVYMTEDFEVAKRYGEIVIAVDTKELDQSLFGTYHEMMCDILKTSDFWHYGDNIPRSEIALIEMADSDWKTAVRFEKQHD